MAISIPGLISIIVFYVIVLAIGIWAARRHRRTSTEVMLAGRNVGLGLGVLTMTATWCGGGMLNGTSEVIFTPGFGLAWCQAPIGFSLSLTLGGIFFAKRMREMNVVTMIDPIQTKLGNVMGAFLFLPTLAGEIFYSASILSALGTTLTVILELESSIAIIVSACVAVTYTLIGGLRSVMYTDVIQILCVFVGLYLSAPFAFTHPAVNVANLTITGSNASWIGSIEPKYAGMWVDIAFLLLCGGIPWQSYFQRCLASRDGNVARLMSVGATIGVMSLALPAAWIGTIASVTDWNQTDYSGEIPLPPEDYKLVLPLVLQYLCPTAVAFIGLGGISAAVMSSTDSAMLSAATIFSHNVYQRLLRPKASDREVIWVMRACIVVFAIVATSIAILVTSVYGLFVLCADLIYVILFPQLCCVFYFKKSNTYGSIVGYILGLLLRIGGGEPIIKFPAFIQYPFYNVETNEQLFPFRTFTMLVALISMILVSLATHYMFTSGCVDSKFDFLNAVGNDKYAVNDDDIGEKTQSNRNGVENKAFTSKGDDLEEKTKKEDMELKNK